MRSSGRFRLSPGTPLALLGCAMSLATLASSLVAREGTPGLPADRERAIDRFVGPFVDLAMFDGTILVDMGGEVVYEKSFGYASYELGVAHDAQTRFRIASVSKSLTDVALAVLIQRSALTLATPLARYLPRFPSAKEITIDHLVRHTSGIPHTNDLPWGNGKTSFTLDEIVERVAALPLDFDPGADSSYSNGGYAVLAKVLEIAGGGTFAEVMRQTVFAPLGMKDTDHIADARAPIPSIATGYEPGRYPGERRHSRFYAVETRPGGGSFYSTARDLLRFTRGVFREGFITEELRRSVLETQTEFFQGVDGEVFLSQGRSPGFVAKLYYDRARDLIVVSLGNSYAVPADWAGAIADLADGTTASEPWPEFRRAATAVPSDDPRLGRYQSSRGSFDLAIERTQRGAMIIADKRSESITGLIPLADGGFLQPLYFQRCEQASDTRMITCRMLSGNPRYTNEFSPSAE